MRWLKNIASRAALGFALVWAITAVAIIGAAVLARDASDVLERTLIVHADDLMHASQAQVAAERMVAVGRGYLLTRSTDLLTRAKEAEDDLDVALQALDRGNVEPPEQALLREVQRSASEYRRLLDEAFESRAAEDPTRAGQRAPRASPPRARGSRRQARQSGGAQAAPPGGCATAGRRDWRVDPFASRFGLGALALVLSALLAQLFTRRLRETSRREQASTQKATRALAARDELLGIVAHDLRNPLHGDRPTGVPVVARRRRSRRRALARTPSSRSAAACRYLIDGPARRGHDRGGTSVGGARAVRRREPSSGAPSTHSRPLANEKSIRLQEVVTPLDLSVWADRERLFQVLSNLIANALKFTPEHGVVTISAREEHGAVRFEVSPTPGIGIAPEHLPRIFDRYWKSDTRSARGAGLGLYIAKGIVEAHGGRIWVESTPGIGSSFQFELPNPAGPRRDDRQAVAPRTDSGATPRSCISRRGQPAHHWR